MLYGKKPVGTLSYLGGLPAILEPFCWSWGQLVMHTQEALCTDREFVHLIKSTISDHAPARNDLAARFLGDWLFMTDTDHSFEPDLVVRLVHLMKTHEVDVLTGTYQFKTPPYSPVMFSFPDDEDPKCVIPIADWTREAGIIEIGSAGGGCLLIRRNVFERIGKELKEQPFDKIPPFSEDHSFFLRCRRLSIPVWWAPRVESHHLRVHPVSLADYNLEEVILSDHIPTGGAQ